MNEIKHMMRNHKLQVLFDQAKQAQTVAQINGVNITLKGISQKAAVFLYINDNSTEYELVFLVKIDLKKKHPMPGNMLVVKNLNITNMPTHINGKSILKSYQGQFQRLDLQNAIINTLQSQVNSYLVTIPDIKNIPTESFLQLKFHFNNKGEDSSSSSSDDSSSSSSSGHHICRDH